MWRAPPVLEDLERTEMMGSSGERSLQVRRVASVGRMPAKAQRARYRWASG